MILQHYYNEIDPAACGWLEDLMVAELIAPGKIDSRSIEDVQPSDLDGFTSCHFFAGVGGWPLALRLAGWPDDRPVWSGSCPCQPFSTAGEQRGTADERHLWPEFFRLIQVCRPPAVVGEQVASQLALGWLDGVSADLESQDYSVGAADLCAACVGAPHIRQRLYWLAHAQHDGGRGNQSEREQKGGVVDGRVGAEFGGIPHPQPGREGPGEQGEQGELPQLQDGRGFAVGGGVGGVCDPQSRGLGIDGSAPGGGRYADQSESVGGMANNASRGYQGGTETFIGTSGLVPHDPSNFWSDYIVLPFRDGKYRRACGTHGSPQPRAFPAAHGIPAGASELLARLVGLGLDPGDARKVLASARKFRTTAIRGYGNAIVLPLAVHFVETCLEIL